MSANGRKTIVLIGAGSVSFTRGLIADMLFSERPWEVRLCDTSAEALETAEGLARRMLDHRPADVILAADVDRRALLPGADAVVTTIAVGGRRSWETDVFIPRTFGIFQPVGDSVLPGGISRALRHCPVLVDIARDFAELCPEALFINYSNPMSALCRAVRQATDVPVIGLCHGVPHVQRYLADFAGLPRGEVSSVAVGVNHLTWFLELRHRGADAWPQVRRTLEEQSGLEIDRETLGRHIEEAGQKDPEGRPLWTRQPLSWELFRTYGAFPAVLDRHVAEFFPPLCREGGYYGRTLGVETIAFEPVIEHGDTLSQAHHDQARGKAPLETGWATRRGLGEHEQLIEILEACWSDKPRVYSVNLPNTGQVANLPHGAIIECPALVDGRGFHPLAIGELPEGLAGILRRRISSQQLSVDAALSGDRNLLVQALIADGALMPPSRTEALAGELLAAQREHLPQFFR